ncbi:MAG: hypothetical protein ACOZQL_40025 [Myxococcota bacterium]
MSKPGPQQQLYQQLLTCLRGDWHSMVVVPASPGSSAAMVANALVEVSTLVRGKKARLFSTEGLGVNDVSKVIVDMMQHIGTGGLAVASIDSVISAQSGIPVALATDVALLVVHLGLTETADARRTVEVVGEKKFLGAVTIEAGQ